MSRIRIDRLSIRLPPGASRAAVEEAVTRALAADRRVAVASRSGEVARAVGGEVSRAVDSRLARPVDGGAPSGRRR